MAGTRVHGPPVELPTSNASSFFEEAKVGAEQETEVKRKFDKFCTRVRPTVDGTDDACEVFLTLNDFCRLMQAHDSIHVTKYWEPFFHAMDRDKNGKLTFQEFFLGVCAADPATVHILNSFTGYERSRFIFDYYDVNKTGALEWEEFVRLIGDCMATPVGQEIVERLAVEKARELDVMQGDQFVPIQDPARFYDFVQHEKLRGTSRLFRFTKSLSKPSKKQALLLKQPPPPHQQQPPQAQSLPLQQGRHDGAVAGEEGPTGTLTAGGGSWRRATSGPPSSDHPPHGHAAYHGHGHANGEALPPLAVGGPLWPGQALDVDDDVEDLEWHAQLLDLDGYGQEADEEAAAEGAPLATVRAAQPPPYSQLLPPAPPPQESFGRAGPEDSCAQLPFYIRVTSALSDPYYSGLLPNGAPGAPDDEPPPFTAATVPELLGLCARVSRLAGSEDSIIEGIVPPVKIFGSLHGQLLDLLSYFKWLQAPTNPADEQDMFPTSGAGDIQYTSYVFLGNYADRGSCGLETLLLLLCLKASKPQRVFLLRGQHESRHLNWHLGLRQECERRLGAHGALVFERLNEVFDHLPLAALVRSSKGGPPVLALGPGVLPPALLSGGLGMVKRLRKPRRPPHPHALQGGASVEDKVLLELFTPGALMPPEFGGPLPEPTEEQVAAFCAQNHIAAVVVGHQVPQRGYAFSAGGQLVSVCSCLNYGDLRGGNEAALLHVIEEHRFLSIRPKVISARVGQLYGVLGQANPPPGPGLCPRWPPFHVRAVTPERVRRPRPRGALVDRCSMAVGMLLHESGAIQFEVEDPQRPLGLFPAFGPGRPPGGYRPPGGGGGGSLTPVSGGACSQAEVAALVQEVLATGSSLAGRRPAITRAGSLGPQLRRHRIREPSAPGPVPWAPKPTPAGRGPTR